MRCCKKERRFRTMLAWFLLVVVGILFLGCDHIQGLLGIGGEEDDNSKVPDVLPPPVAFRTYYVAADGSDADGGTSEAPLKTVEVALEKLVVDYAKEDWPDKGDPKEGFGEIIIQGLVTASSTISIEGSEYPPIVLRGKSGESTLAWSGGSTETDYLLKINGGAKITLEDDLTLTRTANNGGLVYVENATFTMNGGKIADGSASVGGGVYVGGNGVFTMNEGTIEKNTSVFMEYEFSWGGGGVYVAASGAFTMNGGDIAGNTASRGGGVYVAANGAFTMSGGNIAKSSARWGGGVFVHTDSMFTMSGGNIENNTINGSGSGGGVFSDGAFTMSGGKIADNSAKWGGGVYLSNAGMFTMEKGTIANNTATEFGGGVGSDGAFIMNGGEIASNSAAKGGGVYIVGDYNGTLQKNFGGIIYGTEEEGKKNTAAIDQGHAVYVNAKFGEQPKKRDTIVGEGVSLNSNTADGWD